MAYGGLQGQAPQGVAPINGLPTNNVRELTVRSGYDISAGDVVDVEGGEVFKSATTKPIVTNNNIYSNIIGTIPPTYMLYCATSKEGYLTLTLSDVVTYKDVNTIDIPSRNLSYSVKFYGSIRLSNNSFIVVFGNRGWKEFHKITIEQNTIKHTKIGEKEFTTFNNSIFLKLNDSKILVSGRQSGGGKDIYVELDITTKTFNELSYNSMYVEGISPTPLGDNLFIIGSKDLGDYQDFRLFKYTGTAFNRIAEDGLDEYSHPIASIPFGNNKIVCLFERGGMSTPSVRTYSYSSSALTPITTKILNTGDTPAGSYGNSTPSFVKVGNQIVVALAEPKAKKTFIEILEISEDGKTITEKYRTVVSNEQQGSNLYGFGNTSNIFWQSIYSSSQSTKAANIILYNNQFVGEILDTSKTAIALQSGTSGQTIPVGFGGYCPCDGIVEGQMITSSGVMGYGVQDGWLDVRPSYWGSSQLELLIDENFKGVVSNQSTYFLKENFIHDIDLSKYIFLVIKVSNGYEITGNYYVQLNGVALNSAPLTAGKTDVSMFLNQLNSFHSASDSRDRFDTDSSLSIRNGENQKYDFNIKILGLKF